MIYGGGGTEYERRVRFKTLHSPERNSSEYIIKICIIKLQRGSKK